MPIESANWYHPGWKENPYTHLLQTKIRSMGQRYGCRIPDILLTMQYKLDAKMNVLERPEPKLTFQPDGPSDAQLNFSHDSLKFGYDGSLCVFDVSMDALFGEGVIIRENTTYGGTLGVDKIVKGELQGSKESGRERPGPRTTLHARIHGTLNANLDLLDVWGRLI